MHQKPDDLSIISVDINALADVHTETEIIEAPSVQYAHPLTASQRLKDSTICTHVFTLCPLPFQASARNGGKKNGCLIPPRRHNESKLHLFF